MQLSLYHKSSMRRHRKGAEKRVRTQCEPASHAKEKWKKIEKAVKRKKQPKANRCKLVFNTKKRLTLISQSRSILRNSANIPSANLKTEQETFFMHLQFHKTLVFPWLADCLDPEKSRS